MRVRWLGLLALTLTSGCIPLWMARQGHIPIPAPQPPATVTPTSAPAKAEKGRKIVKSEEEWKKSLTPEQYRILRQKGTETAFTGKYWNHKDKGAYFCAGCDAKLFHSDTKYDSGCGWPSFWEAAEPDKIDLKEDLSYGMRRMEVLCKQCGGHLGHIFDDGPPPTGKRYCINSGSIVFRKGGE